MRGFWFNASNQKALSKIRLFDSFSDDVCCDGDVHHGLFCHGAHDEHDHLHDECDVDDEACDGCGVRDDHAHHVHANGT